MKRYSERYLIISVILFLISMAIIPVGGFASSNPHAKDYINLFLACEINLVCSLIFLWWANRKPVNKQ